MSTPVQRPIGINGPLASTVALGTWAIGGDDWGGSDETLAIEAIHASLDAGINLIDTAPVYGFGLSEEIVGRAIAGRRDQVVLATKCGLIWGGTEGQFFFPSPRGPIHRYQAPTAIRGELERSLRRLGTDYIDLYQTHWQDDTTPIADTMGELLKLRDEGKIRAIGVSNVTPSQLLEYTALGVVASAQEGYSMVDREQEPELMPLCERLGVSLLAYSPLAMGLLSGKITADRVFPVGDMRRGNARFAPTVLAAVNAFLAKIAPVAEGHGITLAQLVFAWTLTRPAITHVLCGARDAKQARENAAAGRVVLSADEVAFITRELDAAELRVPKVFG